MDIKEAIEHCWDRKDYPEVFRDDAGLDISIPGFITRGSWIRNNSPRTVTLDVTTYRGVSWNADLIKNGNTRQGIAVYDRATGACRSSNYKKLWIVDIDSKDDEYRNRIISLINECRGTEGDRIKHIIPTVNGYHLISNGFDRQQFSRKLALYQLDQIDIHDNNPTLLYYKTLC